jgi:hypothetical protein
VHIVPIELNIESCLYYLACDVLCTTCRVLYDGDWLLGSTLLYTILVVDVLPFIRLDMQCLVDSHR